MMNYTCDLDHRGEGPRCTCAVRDRGPRCPFWRRMTASEIEEGRNEIRNDPGISDAVKGAMEHFWKLLDQQEAQR